MLPVLRETGCLFVTSAVESIDDTVLEHLRKGHTRAGFVRAVSLCRDAGLTLAPTFVPFTPWTTREGYAELIELLDTLDLIDHVAPIQLAIRLLITAGSPLLELPDIRRAVSEFDPASLTCPWVHADPAVDALQQQVMTLVAGSAHAPRLQTFRGIAALAGTEPRARRPFGRLLPPTLSEPWYCCAEPLETF
ncbi:MAG: hypothetical protein FJW14_18615 [Acidimicrobiia bacterium]|nr:hypothetical protein [Acidimicrobiia bacterium]